MLCRIVRASLNTRAEKASANTAPTKISCKPPLTMFAKDAERDGLFCESSDARESTKVSYEALTRARANVAKLRTLEATSPPRYAGLPQDSPADRATKGVSVYTKRYTSGNNAIRYRTAEILQCCVTRGSALKTFDIGPACLNTNCQPNPRICFAECRTK